jgi:hypothetical protein
MKRVRWWLVVGKNKHLVREDGLAVSGREMMERNRAVLEERFKCANLAQEFRDRCNRDGMLAAAYAAEEISTLIRNRQ